MKREDGMENEWNSVMLKSGRKWGLGEDGGGT
jgi:hypothetical protein